MDTMDALQKYYGGGVGNLGRVTPTLQTDPKHVVEDTEIVHLDKNETDEARHTVEDHGFDPSSPEGKQKIKEVLEAIRQKKREKGVQKAFDMLKATASRGRPRRRGGGTIDRGSLAASSKNEPWNAGPARKIVDSRFPNTTGDQTGEGQASPKPKGSEEDREYEALFDWIKGGQRGKKPYCEKHGDCGAAVEKSLDCMECQQEPVQNLEKWVSALVGGATRALAGGAGKAGIKQGIKDSAQDFGQEQVKRKITGGNGGNGGDTDGDAPIGQPYTILSVEKAPKSSAVNALVAMAAGWALSSDITDKDVPPHLVREWERAVSQQDKTRLQEEMIRRLRHKLRKSEDDGNFLDDLQILYKDHAPLPPRYGLLWDAVKHRWTRPEKVGRTVWEVQGKIRYRGTGSGAHERSRSAKGSGGYGVGSSEAGRRFRTVGDSAKQHPHEAKHPGQHALHPFRKPAKRKKARR